MNIYQTINAIMAEVEPIGKDSWNSQQKFKYRGVDAVMNSLQPLFAKHKLFCVPEVLTSTREERQSKSGGNLIYSIIRTKYTFYAEDGSNVSAIVEGEGMDSADKSTNKALAIAFKYACFQLFCIPTEETSPDPDKESHNVVSKKDEIGAFCERCGAEIKPQKINGKDYTAHEIKEKCKGLCLSCYKEETQKPEETKIKEVEVEA